MNSKDKIEVSLLGQRFTIKTDRDEIYVQDLIRRVAKDAEDIRRQAKVASTHHLSLLVAIHFADLLLKKEEELERLKQEMNTKTDMILQQVEETLEALDAQEFSKPQ